MVGASCDREDLSRPDRRIFEASAHAHRPSPPPVTSLPPPLRYSRQLTPGTLLSRKLNFHSQLHGPFVRSSLFIRGYFRVRVKFRPIYIHMYVRTCVQKKANTMIVRGSKHFYRFFQIMTVGMTFFLLETISLSKTSH